MKDEDKNNLQGKHLETGYIEIPTEHRADIDITVAAIPCLICGEPVPVSIWENHSKICDKCKKAILKLRKMFDEE